MNWGAKIAMFYGGFVLLILSLVFAASKQEFHLVTENYYGEELNHPARMQREQNSRSLTESISVSYQSETNHILIRFPKDKTGISGEVLLYRPSDSHQDLRLSLTPDNENNVLIPTDKLIRGLWRVQIDWKSGGTGYYDEEAVVL